jgi:hypothetical protein
MDETKLQPRDVRAIRTFRICVHRPERPTTILGVIRRVADEQAMAGPARRPVPPLPRRFSAFA